MEKRLIVSPIGDQLQTLENLAAGTLDLETEPLTHEDLVVLAQFITQHGVSLFSLKTALEFQNAPYHHDWYQLDFVQICPDLKSLKLERIDVNHSIFSLTQLVELHLTKAYIRSDETIHLPPVLERIELEDVNWVTPPTIAIKQQAHLKKFSYTLDEDSVESVPNRFIFEDCSALESIGLSIEGGRWEVIIKGLMPKLEFSARSGRFGFHTIDLSAVADGSRPSLIQLRDGVGRLKSEVIAFTHNSNRFNVDKAKQAIRLLGGAVADSPDAPAVTTLVIGNKEYKDFDETPYEHLEIFLESDFRDDIFEWY